MSQSNAKGANVPVAGDLTGSIPTPTVVAINGTSVPASPLANTVLTATSGIASIWAKITDAEISSAAAITVAKLAPGASGQILQSNSTPTPIWTTISGDVALTDTGITTVVAIQGFPVSTTTPTTNQVLEWNGTQYVPTTITAILAGDVTGAIGSNVVVNIHGASVPIAGSLTIGNVLQVSGSTTLNYSAINLAGGSNFVSGVLPTANQASQIMGGDVTGTTASNTVTKIQGNTFTSGTPSKGQFVVATSTTNYGPVTISGDVAESGTTAGFLTVVGIDGYAISGGPILGQFLEYNGTNLVWTSPTAGVTWANDLSGSTATNQWVASISGSGGSGGSIPFNATTLVFGSSQSTPAILQTALGTVVGTGVAGQLFTVIAQTGQATTGAGNNAGNGGNLILSSGAGGTASGGTPGTAGNVIIQSGGTTQATISIAGVSVSSLAGSGAGFVAVNNTGLLSFVSGISPTGAASGDLSGSYPGPTVVALQGNSIQSGVLGVTQDGYALVWNNSTGKWTPEAISSGSVTLGGDVTGISTNNNVSAISGGSPIIITPNEFQWLNTSVPLIDQAALASTSSGSGASGQAFTVAAQTGQAATGASNNGGAGGNLVLKAGAGGTSGSATAGKDGNVQINSNTNNIITFYDYDFNSDGYSDAIVLGSSISEPEIYQSSLTSTSSGSGSVGQNLYIAAQTGQAATGAGHNGGNGGNLILTSGSGGTSTGGTPGSSGSIILKPLAGNGSGIVGIDNSGVLSFTATSTGNTVFNVNGFRLTLTSGTPVTTSDVTGAGTIYCSPMTSTQISLYVSSVWTIVTSAQFSLALTVTINNNYDVFCYFNSGVATLELSSAWTNATTRNDAISQQDGVWVKSSDHSRRYLGTIRATGTNTTEDSVLNRFVYNFYNQQPRELLVTDNTATWNYTTAAWRQARGITTNNWSYIVGMPYERLYAEVLACESGANNGNLSVGIGIDSTSVNSAKLYGSGGQTSGGLPTSAMYRGSPGLGYHNIVWLEWGNSSGQFYGNVNSLGSQIAGMEGEIMA